MLAFWLAKLNSFLKIIVSKSGIQRFFGIQPNYAHFEPDREYVEMIMLLLFFFFLFWFFFLCVDENNTVGPRFETQTQYVKGYRPSKPSTINL